MTRLFLGLVALIPALVLLLPAIAVAALFVVVASMTRALARVLEPRYVSWTELVTFDSRFGWKPRPLLDAYYLADRDDVHRIVTDAEGWPGRQSVENSAVVVIGDSFAFGYGVDTGRSFADLNAQLPVKGIGAPGYSMVQGVLLMEELGERLTGKLVVWFICLENDLQDAVTPGVSRYRAPFVRRSPNGEWNIVTEHVVPMLWQSPDWSWKRIFPHLCVATPMSDRVYEGCDYLVRRAATACQRAQAHLVLVTIPDLSQLTEGGRAKLAALSGTPEACDVDLPDRRLGEICQRYGVRSVRGKDYLSAADYKRREGLHWNGHGHEKVSQLIAQLHDSLTRGELFRAPSSVGPLLPGRDAPCPPVAPTGSIRLSGYASEER